MLDATANVAGPGTLAAAPSSGTLSPAGPRERRLVRSVLSNWGFSLVELFVGFAMPRLISDRLGQELLGVWDVSWSLVFWVRWTNLGVTGAVTRYVAHYRALRDWARLNASVNTSLAFLLLGCLLAVSLGGVFAALAPYMLREPSPQAVNAAGWTIILLTAAAGLQMPAGVFNSVITGYERFDLLNVIRCTRDITVLLAVTGLLLTGGGLAACAAVTLAAEMLASVAKYLVARRICPHLRLSARYCRWQAARELGLFGGKTVVRDLARGGIYHLSNLLVAGLLGPAAVAVYSRQRTLVMYLTRFVKQYANVFIPASSELHAAGDLPALRRMLVDSGRYAFYIALPPIWLLLLLGGPLVQTWMGPHYSATAVLSILVVGHALTIPQTSAYSILMGMSQHGAVALYEGVALALSAILGWLFLGPLQWGLCGAALALVIPLTISGGVLLPWVACRRLGLPLPKYLYRVAIGPLTASLPLLSVLGVVRAAPLPGPLSVLAIGVGLGTVVTALTYWHWVVPQPRKLRLMHNCARLGAWLWRLCRPGYGCRNVEVRS